MKALVKIAAPLALLLPVGCIQLNPSDKPVHIILDVNLKVQMDRELDKYFGFEEKTPPKPETKPETKPEAKPEPKPEN